MVKPFAKIEFNGDVPEGRLGEHLADAGEPKAGGKNLVTTKGRHVVYHSTLGLVFVNSKQWMCITNTFL